MDERDVSAGISHILLNLKGTSLPFSKRASMQRAIMQIIYGKKETK